MIVASKYVIVYKYYLILRVFNGPDTGRGGYKLFASHGPGFSCPTRPVLITRICYNSIVEREHCLATPVHLASEDTS